MTTPSLGISKQVYDGRILKVVHQEIQFPTGQNLEYEIVKRSHIVNIIPIISVEQILLIRQYRAPINAYIWEFPGGTVEDNETLEDTATRELNEETGYTAKMYRPFMEFYTSPHYSNERISVFIAEGVTSSGSKKHQEREFIENHIISHEHLRKLVSSDEIIDSKTLAICLKFLHNR